MDLNNAVVVSYNRYIQVHTQKKLGTQKGDFKVKTHSAHDQHAWLHTRVTVRQQIQHNVHCNFCFQRLKKKKRKKTMNEMKMRPFISR